MKVIRLILFLWLAAFGCQAQQMVYVKNGTVSINNILIKHPRQLKKILEKQNAKTLNIAYKKYIRHRRIAQFFSTIAGLGLVYSVENEFGPNPTINWPLAGIAVGASIAGELFHRPSDRALKEIVELHNEEVYFHEKT